MSKPAVLTRDRSIVRCLLTGIVGFIGLVVAAVGEILMLGGDTAVGAAGGLIAAGVVVLVLAEMVARRFWVLDTIGFHWERSLGGDDLPWGQAAFATEELSRPDRPRPGPEDNDHLIVVGPDRRPHRWGRTVKHHQAVTTVRKWEQMRGAYADGRFDIGQDTKPFHLLVDGPELHTMRVRMRVGGQSVIAVLTLLAGLLCAAGALTGVLTERIGFAVLAALLLTWFVVALRNLTSSVQLRPEGLLQRRWGVRRLVGWHEIAGVNVVQRPKAVSVVPLAVGLLIFWLWGSLHSDGDEAEAIFAAKSHPQLILRDGTGVEMSALSTRSVGKANRFAYALSLARRVGT